MADEDREILTFTELVAEFETQTERVAKLPPDPQRILQELSGTILPLMRDLAISCESFENEVEDQLDPLKVSRDVADEIGQLLIAARSAAPHLAERIDTVFPALEIDDGLDEGEGADTN